MPGDYPDDEIRNMTTIEFQAAKQRNWKRPDDEPIHVETPTPAPTTAPAGEYGSSWNRKAQGGFDFVTPSGERCLMRQVPIEAFLQAGILDKVSRLEGLAETLIQSAEGAPPTPERMPSAEEFEELLRVINTVTRLAVVKPVVVPDDKPELAEGEVRVSWIELSDRSAIMERALVEVRKLDNFRNAG